MDFTELVTTVNIWQQGEKTSKVALLISVKPVEGNPQTLKAERMETKTEAKGVKGEKGPGYITTALPVGCTGPV